MADWERHAVMIDFGSTYTKVVVVDRKERRLLLSNKFPSTVHEDARIGLEECFGAAKQVLSPSEFDAAMKLSSSSTAGGLRMAVVGLTRSLSVTAGRDAVFGAGAKVMGTFYGWLTEEMVEKLNRLDLEIVFFCGGYDNGNTSMILHNAKMLAASTVTASFVYSGNQAVAKLVRAEFTAHMKECFVIDNILPAVGVMNPEPSRNIIRELFMKRITNMKGLKDVKDSLDGILMPTPAAVLAAGTLLSEGMDEQEGLGELMMTDVGGATTDIYSFSVNRACEDAILTGVPEPYAKRTVEGDMGMRESSVCVMREAGADDIAAKAGITRENAENGIEKRITETSYLADTEAEYRLDQAIAETAVYISVRRHAGKLELNNTGRCNYLQRGKNLRDVKRIIGTGGPVVNSRDPAEILRQAERTDSYRDMLLPENLELYIDRDYVLFAAGLLLQYDPEAAFAVMRDSITKVE